MKKLILLMLLILSLGIFSNLAATLLIDPAVEGGFESGPLFSDNGWTEVNGTQALKWYLGTAPTQYAGNRCAFSSNASTTWTGQNTTSVSYFYRDINFPSGETTITLQFYYKILAVDSGYDYVRLFLVDPTTTPVAGTMLASGGIGVTTSPFYAGTTSWVQYTVTIPAANAGTLKRLVFAWRNDSASPMGAGAIDNISLVSTGPLLEPDNHVTGFAAGTLNYTSIQLNWTGSIGTNLPGNYLIQAIKSGGSYLAVGDGVPVVNDAIWTDNNAAINVAHVVGANTYTFTGLTANTAYEFKIWPYSNTGSIINFKIDGLIPTVNASTLNPLVIIPPDYSVNFGTLTTDWPVPNWTTYSYLYGGTPATGGSWFQDDWLNVTSPLNKAAKINIFTSGQNSWLVTPPVQVPAGSYELKFDLALMVWNTLSTPVTPGNQGDDRLLLVMSDNANMSSPTTLMEWNAAGPNIFQNIPATGGTYIYPLTGITGIKYFAFYAESILDDLGDNDLMVDNFFVRATPLTAIFTLAPDVTTWNFGTVQVNLTATKTFTVTNTGGANLTFSSIQVTGTGFTPDPAFDTSPIAPTQSRNFTVKFSPTAEQAYTGSLVFNFTRETRTVALSGAGDDPSVTIPPTWTESFETVTVPALPLGWSAINNAPADTYWRTSTSYPRTGTRSLYINYNAVSPLDDWVISPPLNLTVGYQYSVEFWYRSSSSYPEKLKLMLGSAPTAAGMTTTVVDIGAFTSATYLQSLSYFTAPSTGTFYLGWYAYSDPDEWYIAVDDITVTYIPPNPPAVVNMTYPADAATGIPSTGFNLTWTPGGGGVPDNYTVFLSLTEADIYDSWTANTTGTTFNPVTQTMSPVFPGFIDGQTYYWSISANKVGYDSAVVEPPHMFTIQSASAGIILKGNGVLNDVTLNWVPYNNDGTLNWNGNTTMNSIGYGTSTGTFQVATRFETPMLAGYIGQYLTKLSIVPGESVASGVTYTLKVWSGVDGSLSPAAEIYSLPLTTWTADAWNEFTIPGIQISGTQALWLGYETYQPATAAPGLFPAGCDVGPAVDTYGDLFGELMVFESLHMSVPSLNYNWCIIGTITQTRGEIARLTNIPASQHSLKHDRNLVLSAEQNTAVTPLENNRYFTGYSVYRNNVLLNATPIFTTTYSDLDIPDGNYTYFVRAVYVNNALTVQSNDWSYSFYAAPPFALPFYEGWDAGNFANQLWAQDGANWIMSTTDGTPEPSAEFYYYPSVTSYALALTSYPMVGAGHANVWLTFDLALDNYSLATVENMDIEVWDGSTWNWIDTISNQDYATTYAAFEYLAYDITAYAAGHDFQVRFLANGGNSFNIDAWYVDNINVFEMPATLAAPVLTITEDDPDVFLEWAPVTGATWYGIYASTDPYGTFTYLGYLQATYTGVYFTAGDYEFFYVTAGAGALPRGRELTRGVRR